MCVGACVGVCRVLPLRWAWLGQGLKRERGVAIGFANRKWRVGRGVAGGVGPVGRPVYPANSSGVAGRSIDRENARGDARGTGGAGGAVQETGCAEIRGGARGTGGAGTGGGEQGIGGAGIRGGVQGTGCDGI